MTSSAKGTALITSATSGVGAIHRADRFAQRGFDLRRPQPGGSSETTTLNRADQPAVVTAKKPARILLVDAGLALQESHLLLLRSIPAIVENHPYSPVTVQIAHQTGLRRLRPYKSSKTPQCSLISSGGLSTWP
jgi:hypothetical protein